MTLNYKQALEKKEWDIVEAAFLVSVGNKSLAKRIIRDAQIDAEKGNLPYTDKISKKDGIIYVVQPRIFLQWCRTIGRPLPPEINRYMNYDYWVEKKYWTLNEAIALITNKEHPPFPHEVRNVIETTSKTESLFRIAKILIHHFIDHEKRLSFEAWDVDKDYGIGEKHIPKTKLLDWLKQEKIWYPLQLDAVYQKEYVEKFLVRVLENIQRTKTRKPKKKGKATNQFLQEALNNFIDALESDSDGLFDRNNIKGRKVDFCRIVKKYCPAFKDHSLATIGDYLQRIGITFPKGNKKTQDHSDYWGCVLHNLG